MGISKEIQQMLLAYSMMQKNKQNKRALDIKENYYNRMLDMQQQKLDFQKSRAGVSDDRDQRNFDENKRRYDQNFGLNSDANTRANRASDDAHNAAVNKLPTDQERENRDTAAGVTSQKLSNESKREKFKGSVYDQMNDALKPGSGSAGGGSDTPPATKMNYTPDDQGNSPADNLGPQNMPGRQGVPSNSPAPQYDRNGVLRNPDGTRYTPQQSRGGGGDSTLNIDPDYQPPLGPNSDGGRGASYNQLYDSTNGFTTNGLPGNQGANPSQLKPRRGQRRADGMVQDQGETYAQNGQTTQSPTGDTGAPLSLADFNDSTDNTMQTAALDTSESNDFGGFDGGMDFAADGGEIGDDDDEESGGLDDADMALPDAPRRGVPADDDDNDEDDSSDLQQMAAADDDENEPKAAAVKSPEQMDRENAMDGTRTSGGFDARERLPHVAHAVHLGLVGFSDLLREDQGQGAVNPAGLGLNGILHHVKASPEDMDKLERMADPKGELNKSSRLLAALDIGVNGFTRMGDMAEAKKMATSLLATAGLDAQKHGAYALQLLREGKDKEAADMVAKAYDYVPDGHSIRAAQGPDGKLHAVLKDADTGDEQDLGAFDRQHLIKMATGVANGSEYMQQLMKIGGDHLASVRGAAGGKGGGPKPPTTQELTFGSKEADTMMASKGRDKFGPGNQYDSAIHDLTGQISAQNKLYGDQAANLVNEITDPREMDIKGGYDPKAGVSANDAAGNISGSIGGFHPIKGDAQGRWEFHSATGQKIVMDNNTAQGLLTLRTKRREDLNNENDAAADRGLAESRRTLANQEGERARMEGRGRDYSPPVGKGYSAGSHTEHADEEEAKNENTRRTVMSAAPKTGEPGLEERQRRVNEEEKRKPRSEFGQGMHDFLFGSGKPKYPYDGPEERERKKRRGVDIE